MPIEKIRPKIYASAAPELASLFEQRKAIVAQLTAINVSITTAVQKTPDFAFIKGISSGTVPPMEVEGDHVVFTMNVHNLDQRNIVNTKPITPYVPSVREQLGQSTLNMLLNGPLLSKEEKRRMMSQILPVGIIDGTVAAQPQPGDATEF